MADPQRLIQEFVDAFVTAWPSGDAADVVSFFVEDASYHNGPLPAVHGRPAIQATLEEFMGLGGSVTVDMLNLLADDHVVMTERVDHFVLAGKSYSLPVMGIFEISGGKIAAWRDYFDLTEFSSMLAASN